MPHRRIISLDTDGGIMFDLGIFATLANEPPDNLLVVVGTTSATNRSEDRRRIRPDASTSRP
jgi:hypothetical protein